MFCRSCGKEIPDTAVICTACGVPSGVTQTPPAPSFAIQPYQPGQFVPAQNQFPGASNQWRPMVFDPNAKSKLAAGLLGIFLGAWGVHRFYLGHVGIGIAQIAVTICTCGLGGLWGLIEGILVLTGTINVDAEGRPLRE
jgi:TM2 domain-containing membrane protein YozV